MDAELEEIEFLALSANRVRVLIALSQEPHTRGEIADATDASQATIGRILQDFEERSWLERHGNRYVATPTGELVANGFTDLLTIFEVEGKLRNIVTHLPTDALDFNLLHLADATITTPSQTRPNAPVQRVLELLGDADAVRIFSHAFNEQSLTVIEERTTAGEQTFEAIFSQDVVDALTERSELSRRLRALLDTERAEIRVYDEEMPLAVTVADGVVHLLVRDENGILQASLDTDHAAVREWADRTFSEYWEAATPLDAGDL